MSYGGCLFVKVSAGDIVNLIGAEVQTMMRCPRSQLS
jgi:hypothetical protein